MGPGNVTLDIGQLLFQSLDTAVTDGVDAASVGDLGVVVVERDGDGGETTHQVEAHVTDDINTLGAGIKAVGEEAELGQVVQTQELLPIDDASLVQACQRVANCLVVSAATGVVQGCQEVDVGTQGNSILYIDVVVIDGPG